MNQIDSLRQVLFTDKLVVFAYLFGSRAHGTAGERSDWDMAVYIDDDMLEANPVWQKFEIENRLSFILKTDAVEVVVLNRMDNPVLGFEIINRGMLLVDKDEETRVIFESRVLGRYQDWQYFQSRHMAPSSSPLTSL